MKKCLCVFALICVLCVVFCGCDNSPGGITPSGVDNSGIEPETTPNFLRFDENGEFVILQIADVHECLDQRFELLPENQKYIEDLIDASNPDLVVFTGDNIFPLSTIREILQSDTLRTIDEFAKIMNKKQVYWTMTFGNHDDECLYTKEDQTKRAMKASPDYFLGGFEDTETFYAYFDATKTRMCQPYVGNYIFPIYTNDLSRVAYNVMVLDSGSVPDSSRNGRNAGSPYNHISQGQVDWYDATASKISSENGDSLIPMVSFFHIACEEFQFYLERWDNPDYVINWVGGNGYYYLPGEESAFFEKAVERGDMVGMFTGHNHDNHLSMLVKTENQNMILSTTRQISSYGEARVVKLKDDGSMTTYALNDKGEEITVLDQIDYVK